MENILFQGVCTALVTPFLGEQVNYPLAEVLVKRQIDAGIPAVVLAGTTGESPTLEDDEKLELFQRCKRYAGSDCKIICGTGSNATAHAIAFSQAAQEAGADGLLIVSPYYNKATADGLVAHYMAIAHAVSLPIIVYNVPPRTGQDMPVSVYKRLSYIPNIIGVKEAADDAVKVARTLRETRQGFQVWSGNDSLAVPEIALGAKGVISVVSNVLPRETIAMVDAALDGDFDTASHLQQRLQPVMDALSAEVNPIPIKAAMGLAGYDCGPCRLPLTKAKASTVELLKEFIL